MRELEAFLEQWAEDSAGARAAFLRLRDFLAGLPGIEFAYRGRPGVSHSLRAARAGQSGRPLFAIIDVIDDDPAARWISACLYADLASDPGELATPVPGGILGEDALCFDLEAFDPELLAYVEQRLAEAHAAAAP
ncbi:MAG: hypothetical protein AB1916_11010 [Thermodesulfobacteriota bacterium]